MYELIKIARTFRFLRYDITQAIREAKKGEVEKAVNRIIKLQGSFWALEYVANDLPVKEMNFSKAFNWLDNKIAEKLFH